MFQENMLTNGMYNNAFLICLNVTLIILFGPLYAVFYSLPTSLIFGMIAQCDCFCVVMDMDNAGALGYALMPFRLVQMLLVMALIIVFNAVFWAVMIVPVYIVTIVWGARMLYYWSCGR